MYVPGDLRSPGPPMPQSRKLERDLRWLVIGIIVFVLGMTLAKAVLAQSAAQIIACTPDALRFCNPTPADQADHRRISKCMHAHFRDLSSQCRDALSGR